MYRHSPAAVRSKGIKLKHAAQVCLLIALCFWLIFQLKRSHENKKQHFDASDSSNTRAVVNFGRKDLQPKLEEEEKNEIQTQEEEEGQEANIDKEKDNEIDENDLEESNMEIDREEQVDIIDEDKETEDKENEEEEEEEIDGQTQTENGVDHEEDGSIEHTHEAREEHYKADDASSAVIGEEPNNATLIQERVSESINATSSSNTQLMTSDSTDMPETLKLSESTTAAEENATDPLIDANLETENEDSSDVTHLEENEIWNDIERLREIEIEDSNSEETEAE